MAELPSPPAEDPADLSPESALESQAPPPDSAPAENPAVEISPACRFFLEGRCRFGARCHNPHPDATGNALNSEDRRPAHPDLPSHHPSEKKPAMKTAEDVISRLLWDTQVSAERFSIGYLDRFLGTLEEPFAAFSWEDLASAGPGVLAIPKHRIQYFKYGDRVVWDKATRTDDVFGSTGSGKTILQAIEEEEAAAEAIREMARRSASDGEKTITSERTRHAGAEVDNLHSPSDVEKGLDGAASRQEVMGELKEVMDHSSCIEGAILEGSEMTPEAGGKMATPGHAIEEAELSNPVLNMEQGRLPTMAEDENGAPESRDGRDCRGRKRRPTHFVAVQITSTETREAARHIQRALCEVRPDLAEFCVPLATLHLTLCLLRLETPEDIHRAVAALQELRANSRRLLPPALLLSFQGVEVFYPRVLYMRPASAAELGTLARTLEDAFCRKDLTVIHPPTKEKFHLTVVKVRRGKLRPRLPTDCSWIPPIEDLGTQAIEAICLCEVGQGRRTDGFHTTVLKLDLY